ncbi:hypothetical protein [Paenibacillus sp. LHD-38]|uniref:hypothetical protein n=1 Tax=Paenibacillus sp. LHD-38 TaxID=3072143 RepID=UPI00280C446E|nr:hypothetical protein [Paenibacillus sp. LHD-38]MDQ8735933.1 hypothetical protein [Paenibacillus sp. LHD-38]
MQSQTPSELNGQALILMLRPKKTVSNSQISSVICDINNPDFISKMADIGESLDDRFDGIRILTIGRLNQKKGCDIAIAASLLYLTLYLINGSW